MNVVLVANKVVDKLRGREGDMLYLKILIFCVKKAQDQPVALICSHQEPRINHVGDRTITILESTNYSLDSIKESIFGDNTHQFYPENSPQILIPQGYQIFLIALFNQRILCPQDVQ